MKKLIKLSLVTALAATTLSFNQTERKVYICNTKNAVAYHFKKDCQGLQKCKGTISEVSEQTAKGKELHVCGYEK